MVVVAGCHELGRFFNVDQGRVAALLVDIPHPAEHHNPPQDEHQGYDQHVPGDKLVETCLKKKPFLESSIPTMA